MKYNTPIKRVLIGFYENAIVSRLYFSLYLQCEQQNVIEFHHGWIYHATSCLLSEAVSSF